MSHHPGRRQAAGFSIIEMAVVVAIIAILIAFAVPNFREFLVNYRASTQANDLIADVAFARTEAVKLGRTVRVVADAGGWASGWIVGADLDGDSTITGTEVMRQHGAIVEEFRLVEGGGLTTFSFGPAGNLTVPAAGNIELAVCQPTGFSKHRAIVVNQVGRAEVRYWTGSDFGTGIAVSCT
ncbi:MAG TPA: GspH/FimT family pseudopilin [Xanthomonadales bacterium]|nr:GspH/FimT family pseudopilin [Xanthomonadales bacterium]